MLNVDRRPYVDAGIDKLLDVLIPLRMTAVAEIGMGEFVHDDHLRATRQCRVDIKLLQRTTAVLHVPQRKNLQPFEQRRSLAAPMGLDKPYDDVDAFFLEAPRTHEHRICFADTGGCAEKERQLPPPVLFGQRQQGIGIRAARLVAIILGHRASRKSSVP